MNSRMHDDEIAVFLQVGTSRLGDDAPAEPEILDGCRLQRSPVINALRLNVAVRELEKLGLIEVAWKKAPPFEFTHVEISECGIRAYKELTRSRGTLHRLLKILCDDKRPRSDQRESPRPSGERPDENQHGTTTVVRYDDNEMA